MEIKVQNSHRITITSQIEGGFHHSYVDAPDDPADTVLVVEAVLTERRERGDEAEDITITIEGPQPQPYIDALAEL